MLSVFDQHVRYSLVSLSRCIFNRFVVNSWNVDTILYLFNYVLSFFFLFFYLGLEVSKIINHNDGLASAYIVETLTSNVSSSYVILLYDIEFSIHVH